MRLRRRAALAVLAAGALTSPAVAGASPLANVSGPATGAASGSIGTDAVHLGDYEFIVHCKYTNDRAAVDPILYPGDTSGTHSHSHDFFGNNDTNASSTPDRLRMPNKTTTCGYNHDDDDPSDPNNPDYSNKSAYWAPTLYTPGGTPVEPSHTRNYYRDYGLIEAQRKAVIPFPDGFSRSRAGPRLQNFGVARSTSRRGHA